MPTKVGPGAKSSQEFDRRRGAVLRRGAAGVLAVAGACCLKVPVRAATVTSTWPYGVPGNWDDATKWINSPAAATFPNNGNLGNTYDVVIDKSIGGPTLNVPATVHGLTLGGGGIGTTTANPAPGTNTLTVAGNFRWSGGTFHAPITVASGGSLTIDTSAGTTLTYGGTLTLGGAGSFAGTNAAAIKFDRFDTGFDIQSTGGANGTNTAFAALQLATNGVSQLYSINLNPGAATLVGTIGGGDMIDGCTLAIPEPTTIGLLGGAAALLLRRRSR